MTRTRTHSHTHTHTHTHRLRQLSRRIEILSSPHAPRESYFILIIFVFWFQRCLCVFTFNLTCLNCIIIIDDSYFNKNYTMLYILFYSFILALKIKKKVYIYICTRKEAAPDNVRFFFHFSPTFYYYFIYISIYSMCIPILTKTIPK